jgi:hypothetical protein
VLLRRYWNLPERQTVTSIVLTDRKWSIRSINRLSRNDAPPSTPFGNGRR